MQKQNRKNLELENVIKSVSCSSVPTRHPRARGPARVSSGKADSSGDPAVYKLGARW